MRTEGTLDGVHEMYPATDLEALQARTLDKRFPPLWVTWVYQERDPLPNPPDLLYMPGLRIFFYPTPGRTYAIGADPAEGNPRSDDSVAQIVDAESLQQVAVLAGKIEPTHFAEDISKLCAYWFNAPVLVERNNHGATVIAALQGKNVTLRMGEDGKYGWLTLKRTQRTGAVTGSKVKLYDSAVEMLQSHIQGAELAGQHVDPLLFDFTTSSQISSINANTLSAPENMNDDLSIGWALALMCARRGSSSMSVTAYAGLYPSRDATGRIADKLPPSMRKGQMPLLPQAVLDSRKGNWVDIDAKPMDEVQRQIQERFGRKVRKP